MTSSLLDLQLMSFFASMSKWRRLVCDGVSQQYEAAIAILVFLAYRVGGPSSVHCRSHGLAERHSAEFWVGQRQGVQRGSSVHSRSQSQWLQMSGSESVEREGERVLWRRSQDWLDVDSGSVPLLTSF